MLTTIKNLFYVGRFIARVRRPAKLAIPKGADAGDILAELVKHWQAHNLSAEQSDTLADAMLRLDQIDKRTMAASRYKMRARAVLHEWKNYMPTEQQFIAAGLIADMDDVDGRPGFGAQKLSEWFGLSYAGFAVLPRVMMGKMPDDWQERMAHLLQEFDTAFPNVEDDAMSFKVRGEGPGGRMAKLHPALLDYRHPDHTTLNRWMRQPINDWLQFVKAVFSLTDDDWTTGQIADALASLNTTDNESPDLNWTNAERVVAILEGPVA